jgi:hypothetical protein
MLLFNYYLVPVDHSFSTTLNPCTPQLLVTTRSMSVASFTWHSDLQFHPCCHKWQISFFNCYFSGSTLVWTHGPMLASHLHHACSPRFHSLHGWVPSPLYVCHIFLIHSSDDGDLSCFHFLAMVTGWTVLPMSYFISFFFCIFGDFIHLFLLWYFKIYFTTTNLGFGLFLQW